jgi:hypothetical protein
MNKQELHLRELIVVLVREDESRDRCGLVGQVSLTALLQGSRLILRLRRTRTQKIILS